MELVALFFNSFIVGFSGAMMPGPLLAVSIAETPRYGWKTGTVLSTGHAVAEIFVVVSLTLGLAAVATNKIITQTISVIGGTALIYMGIVMLYEVISGKLKYEADSDSSSSKSKLAGKGITATLSNPYWFIWWATTGLAFLVKSLKFGFIGPVVFYFGHILSDYVWYSVVTITAWGGKKILTGNLLKIILYICALFLIFLGCEFINSSLKII